MNLRFVDYLIALDRERSITRAAALLHVSQSTLSTFLQGFERDAGGVLFFRTNRSLIPTELGKLYLDAARQMASVRESTHTTIRSLDAEHVASVRIGASPNRGASKITACYAAFSKQYPNVRIDITEGYVEHLKDQLLLDKIDLLLSGLKPTEDSRFSHIDTSVPDEILIATHRSSPVVRCARRVADRAHPLLSLSDLANVPVLLNAPSTTIRALIDERFADEKFYPLTVFESANVRLIANLVEQGAGVGFLPAIYIEQGKNMLGFSFEEPIMMRLGVLLRRGRTLYEHEKFLIRLLYQTDHGGREPDEAWERQFAEQDVHVREEAP